MTHWPNWWAPLLFAWLEFLAGDVLFAHQPGLWWLTLPLIAFGVHDIYSIILRRVLWTLTVPPIPSWREFRGKTR